MGSFYFISGTIFGSVMMLAIFWFLMRHNRKEVEAIKEWESRRMNKE